MKTTDKASEMAGEKCLLLLSLREVQGVKISLRATEIALISQDLTPDWINPLSTLLLTTAWAY